MAITVRNEADAVLYAAVSALNLNRALQVGASFHADATSLTSGDFRTPVAAPLTVSAPVASDLPTSLVLANNIQAVGLMMLKDAVSTNAYSAGAHKVPDITNNTVSPTAVDLASAIVLANAWKAQFNVHAVSTAYHYTADTTILTANATILSDLITLLNAIQTKFNSHIASAPAGQMVNIVAA